MSREEMIKTIRDLVGRKMVFDEKWVGLTIGDDRPVVSITSKYVYMGCDCFVRPAWENDEILVSSIRRVPVYITLYGDVTSKVELDSLCTRDLESVYNGVVKYYNWQINKIAGLQQQLDKCLKFQTKYKKVMKK